MLVLAGEDDPACPLPVVEEMASQLPADTTRLVRLAGARHAIFRDRPDLAYPAVTDFVRQVSQDHPASSGASSPSLRALEFLEGDS